MDGIVYCLVYRDFIDSLFRESRDHGLLGSVVHSRL